jgi:CheY-like chemotaxis protein
MRMAKAAYGSVTGPAHPRLALTKSTRAPGVGVPEPTRAERPVLMLVDDDAQVRRAVGLMLEYGGYSVVLAASGAEALAGLTAAECAIRLLLTDLNMPGMSGNELVSQMREQGIELPVLFVSGQPPRALALAEDASVPWRFLAKPFTLATLLTEVKLLLQAAQSAAEP